ncbi:MAG TPA: hypothetical protein VIA18_27500 [Polyangia bacterium]|jgi:hypothetical protein|nr:hypothetical protein [Polyangia bacterium]
MSQAAVVEEGAACRPNISPAGMRRRVRVGWASVVVGAIVFAGLVALHTKWYVRLAMFLPASLAAIGFLQASRKTCVARAGEGTFEHDDFSKTPAPDDDVRRSRAMAATINRDSLLIGVAAAVLAALSAAL